MPDTPTRSRKGGGEGLEGPRVDDPAREYPSVAQQTPTMPRPLSPTLTLSGWIVKRDYEKAAGLNRIQSEAEILLVTPIRTIEVRS